MPDLEKEDLGDGDMEEMIALEIETLNSQLKDLENKLKVFESLLVISFMLCL